MVLKLNILFTLLFILMHAYLILFLKVFYLSVDVPFTRFHWLVHGLLTFRWLYQEERNMKSIYVSYCLWTAQTISVQLSKSRIRQCDWSFQGQSLITHPNIFILVCWRVHSREEVRKGEGLAWIWDEMYCRVLHTHS